MQGPYGLSESQIGLCFLAFGAGCIAAALLNTKRLDRDFRTATAKAVAEKLIPKASSEAPFLYRDCEAFPIEYARLHTLREHGACPAGQAAANPSFSSENAAYFFIGLASATIAYGWLVHFRVHLAVPLIAHFFIGLMSTTITNSTSTLTVDLFPGGSATAVASMNISRCLAGAGGTAVIDPLLKALGPGWTYTTLSLIALLFLPIPFVEMRYGHRFRAVRARAPP